LLHVASANARESKLETSDPRANAMNAQKWLESLVRLAKLLYKETAARGTGPAISECLDKLISAQILPNAGRFDADMLREEIRSPQMKQVGRSAVKSFRPQWCAATTLRWNRRCDTAPAQVLGVYKEMLLRVFEYYAANSNEKGSVADNDATQVRWRL
jgi:hypothetical protein